MFKRILGKDILRYCTEILLAVAFIIISYFGMLNSNLSSYAEAIEDMANAKFGLDISVESLYQNNYGGYSDDIITIYNPKDRKVSCDIILVIESDDREKLNDLVVLADDVAIDLKRMVRDINTYNISTGKREILSNEKIERHIKILGNLKSQSIKYYFNIIEGF